LGTVSPSAKLEVAETDSVTYSSSAIQGDLVVSRKNLAGTVNQVVGLQFDVTGYLGTTTGVAGISAIQTSSVSSAALAFQTRNAGTIGERMRLDASGNLLVG
jgi:selenophosphate synthetase-related protein